MENNGTLSLLIQARKNTRSVLSRKVLKGRKFPVTDIVLDLLRKFFKNRSNTWKIYIKLTIKRCEKLTVNITEWLIIVKTTHMMGCLNIMLVYYWIYLLLSMIRHD